MKELDQVVLTALVHNIGSFWSRQCFWEELTKRLPIDIVLLAPHLQRLIQAASYFARTEREESNADSQPSKNRYLESLLARVTFQPDSPQRQTNYYYRLSSLSLEKTAIYPQLLEQQAISTLEQQYQQLLQDFKQQLTTQLPRSVSHNEISWRNLVYNLMSLLARYQALLGSVFWRSSASCIVHFAKPSLANQRYQVELGNEQNSGEISPYTH
jgi:hypothetical protein